MKKIKNIIISVILSLCMITVSLPVELLAQEPEPETVQESETGEKAVAEIISFEELPEEITQQNVAIGTPIEELQLPDSLKVSYISKKVTFESEKQQEKEKTDTEIDEEKPEDKTDTEIDEEEPVDKTETETDEESSGEEPETESGEEEPENKSGEESETETGETEPEIGSDETEPEESPETEIGETESENVPRTEANAGEREDESRSEGSETVTVHMKEYLSEPDYIYIIEAGILSAQDNEQVFEDENKENYKETTVGGELESAETEHTVAIEGITWISVPEYDADLEGNYIFTPILPEEYILKEGVKLPEIIVIVAEAEETYLLEENPDLSEEEPELGRISTDTIWGETTLTDGTLIVEKGVTLTLTDCVNISGNVTIEGEGRILRGNDAAYINVLSARSLTLCNITVDGEDISASRPMINVNDGTLTLDDGCTIINCYSTSYGGAVYMRNGNVFLKKAKIANCTAGAGGAIYINKSMAKISGAEITNCSASGPAGAIYINNSTAVINGAKITNCTAASDGGAIYMYYRSTMDILDATITDCSASTGGGAIYSISDNTTNIYGGTYHNNSTTSTDNVHGLVGGGFIYNCMSELYIYGGNFIGNTAANKGGCIYHCGHENTTTYLYGGYFEGNTCTYKDYQGSGGVFNSTADAGKTDLYLAGDAHFVGDGEYGSGTDGIYLDQDKATGVSRKIWISDTFNYPVTIYVIAYEGYVIAEGWDDYVVLENRDMKKINFVNAGNDEKQWYPLLDKENNQVILTTTKPSYMDKYFVYYISNGAEGTVKDNNNEDEGYESGAIITVKTADELSFEKCRFIEWNTKADGTGESYHPGDELTITSDIELYAIFIDEGYARYTVEHYIQNLNEDDYTKVDLYTQKLWGAIGEIVTAESRIDKGFTENTTHKSRVDSGRVTEDGTLVLKLYYDRNIYNVSFDLNYENSDNTMAPSMQTIVYGNKLKEVTEPSRKGYSFKGWYTDSAATGNSWDFDNIVENSGTLYAKWVDDIEPVLGEASYNTGYKELKNWIIRKKDLIITVPITEEGSGVDKVEYTLTPENGDAVNGEVHSANLYVPRQIRTNSMGELAVENNRIVAKITISEDYEGTVSLECTDKAGNSSGDKTITASGGGIIVEDNAPRIELSVQDEKDRKRVVDVTISDLLVSDKSTLDDATDTNPTAAENTKNNIHITGGIANVSYQIDDNPSRTVKEEDYTSMQYADGDKSDILLSCKFNVDITGSGEHTLKITAIDNAGNESSKATTVGLEKTAGKKKKTTVSNTQPDAPAYTEETPEVFTPFVQLAKPHPARDKEPDTGDISVKVEIYATIAMIAGMFYILLYFSTGKNGMTEEEKNEFVSRILTWAKRGSSIRKPIAIATIFWVLFYYHSIGKRVQVEWNRVYEK